MRRIVNPSTRVLVTDGDERSALAVTRSLGKRGFEVVVGGEESASLAGVSRYCARTVVYPSPYAHPREFAACLIDLVREHQIRIVIPVSDLAAHLVCENRAEFEEHAVVPMPSRDTFELVSDKYRLMQVAAAMGVAIPGTVFVHNGRVDDVIDGIESFPVVVKPRRSVMRRGDGWEKTGVHYAYSRSDLLKIYATHGYLKAPSLIQQRVQGEGRGVCALMHKGKPLCLFAHRRLREKPPSGGVSVLRESIPLSSPMTEFAVRLLERFQWHGVAMVEFKVEEATGVPCLMEVNGRFWGSLQLAIDSGIDFPAMLCDTALGRDIYPAADGYSVGVRSRWLLGDLDHLLLRIARTPRNLHLPLRCPSKLRTVMEFFAFSRNVRQEVLRFDDPHPFLYELAQYIRTLRGGR